MGEGTIGPWPGVEGTVLSLNILTWISLSPDHVPCSIAVIALVTCMVVDTAVGDGAVLDLYGVYGVYVCRCMYKCVGVCV